MRIKQFGRYALYPGVYLGFTLVFIEFAALFLGLLFHPFLPNIFLILVFLAVSFSIRRYRSFSGGIINFLSAFFVGLTVCSVSGIIWSVYRYFQYKFRPSLLSEVIRTNKEILENSWLDSEQVSQLSELTEQLTTPANLAFLNTFIFSMLVGGSILSLFLALILRREKAFNRK